MQLYGEKLKLGSQRRRSNPWRMLVYGLLIAGGLYLSSQVNAGEIEPLFAPTPVSTRVGLSYAEEARTRFEAGDLPGAIRAYTRGTQVSPNDAQMWAELARTQVYITALQNDAEDRLLALQAAREAIDHAVELDDEDSYVQAIKALVYDWSAANSEFGSPEREAYLTTAEAAAKRASQLDVESVLAQAYYAEVLLDQQNYVQASDIAENAVRMAEARNQHSMDIYRIYANVLESLAEYELAIDYYKLALEYAPRYTMLHLQIGVNYRQLAGKQAERGFLVEANRYYAQALEYFDMAARINEENRILDPTPYLAIGRTYLQQGEFFISARNVLRALTIDPQSADIYGRLGVVYHKARNYESAIAVFGCAVDGCTIAESEALLCELFYGLEPPCLSEEQSNWDFIAGLPLDAESLVYYYTYGSVLAFYAGSEEFPNACSDADRVFRAIERSRFGADPTVLAIIAEGRRIMNARCGGALPPAVPATSTATPSP